jgi:hypothetical protein
MIRLLIVALGMLALMAVASPASAAKSPGEVGDANCSGQTTVTDTLAEMKYIAGAQDTAACLGAGNVICNDDINLDDVEALLRYDAGLPTDMPAPCPEIGEEYPKGHVISSGTMTIYGTYEADFDGGTSNTDIPENDVFWNQQSEVIRSMVPQDAGLALVENKTFDSIDLPYLMSRVYTDDPIDGNDDNTNQLQTGAIFVVHTNAGNYAKVLVTDYGYDIQLQWATYSID